MINSEARLDLLSECINIGLGRAAESLNRMCGSHVVLSAPEIGILNRPGLVAAASGRCPGACEAAFLPFIGVMRGLTALAFAPEDAFALVDALIAAMGLADVSEQMRTDTLREVGNVVLVGVLGAMGSMLGLHVEYQPLFTGHDLSPLVAVADTCRTVTLYVRARFSLERFQATGEIMVVLAEEGFAALMAALDVKIEAQAGVRLAPVRRSD